MATTSKPNRIPKELYSTTHRVTMEMVWYFHTPEEAIRFEGFMQGQTMDASGIYSRDYERWLEEGLRSSQRPETWD